MTTKQVVFLNSNCEQLSEADHGTLESTLTVRHQQPFTRDIFLINLHRLIGGDKIKCVVFNKLYSRHPNADYTIWLLKE